MLKIEPLEPRCLLAAVTLDLNFGDSGLVETRVPVDQGSVERPHGMIQQADGKLLAFGTTGIPSVDQPMVARLNADGTRDTSFGVNGVAILPSERTGWLTAVAVQEDGKILVGGVSQSAYLARLNSDGSLDTTFGAGGYLSWRDQICQIIVQDDGKLIIGADNWNSGFWATRLLADGRTDLSYGEDGTGSIPTSEWVDVFEMALQSDGRLVAAAVHFATDQYTLIVTRFTADGRLDTSFGQSGSHDVTIEPTTGFGEFDLALGADGTIAMVSSVRDASGDATEAKIFALTKEGHPKTTFSGDGIASLSIDQQSTRPGAVGVLDDGSIVVTGDYGPNSSASLQFVAKFTVEGELDSTWASGGYESSDLSESFESVKELLVAADGSFITLVDTWTQENFNDLSITKWLPSGALDESFNGTGIHTINVARPTSYVTVRELLPYPSGGMVLLGNSGMVGEQRFTAVNYSSTGKLNAQFGSGGTQRLPSIAEYARGAVQPDGKVIVATTEWGPGFQLGVYLTRYLSDGTVDPSFSVTRYNYSRPGSIHAQDVLVQPDGKVMVIAIDFNYEGWNTLTRYMPDGRVDHSFGQAGVMGVSGSYGRVLGAVQHANATYLLTGGDFAAQGRLLRVTEAGEIDTAFGSVVVFNEGVRDARLLLDSQQRLIVVSPNTVNRYLLSGAPDVTFGSGGLVELPYVEYGFPSLQGVASNTRGQLFITRHDYSQANLEFVRVHADGSIDLETSNAASAILRSHGFINYPGLLVEGNQITIAGTAVDGLDVEFELIRLQLEEQSAWTNPANRLNVDNDPDDHVVPMDVLLIINQLHAFGPHELSEEGPMGDGGHYFDVNGDNYLSAIDALMIINYLNANPIAASISAGSATAEGENDGYASGWTLEEQLSASDTRLGVADFSDEALACLIWSFEDDRTHRNN